MEFEVRKWRTEDAADLARYANNPKIAQNLRDVFPHPYHLEDAAAYVESGVAGEESLQLCRAIVVDGARRAASACSAAAMYIAAARSWAIGWPRTTGERES